MSIVEAEVVPEEPRPWGFWATIEVWWVLNR